MFKNLNKGLYYGIDPTNDDMHIGHIYALEQAIKIAKRDGYTLFVLIGNATCAMGDPSDKQSARDKMERSRSVHNTNSISNILTRRLGSSVKVVFNQDWLEPLTFFQWLGFFGDFSVNSLLKIKYFRDRINAQKNLPIREFLYFTMQSYDFLHLHNTYNVVAQVGGQDQRNNMIQGAGLVPNSRIYLLPLLTDKLGKAFSKTTHTTILNKGPFFLYNYIINMDDNLIHTYNQQDKHICAMRLIRLYFPDVHHLRLLYTELDEINSLSVYLHLSKNKTKEAIMTGQISKQPFDNNIFCYRYRKFQFYINYSY